MLSVKTSSETRPLYLLSLSISPDLSSYARYSKLTIFLLHSGHFGIDIACAVAINSFRTQDRRGMSGGQGPTPTTGNRRFSKRNRKPLVCLGPSEVGVVVEIAGGRGLRQKLALHGIREGTHLRVIASPPTGPVLVDVSGCQVAVGRGMAQKIFVETRA